MGRIGGDEFVMICHDLALPAAALAVAHRLPDALAHPFVGAGRSVQVSASVGVTMAMPGATPQEMMNRADEAMYQSKRRHDRTPVFLTASTDLAPRSGI